MKIQKLFLAVLSSSVLYTSCMDNFLDTESPSIPSDENLFKSTALTEAALMGVYATMTDTYIYGQKLCVNWQGASDVEVGSGAFSTENYNSTLRDEGAGNFYDDNYNRNTRWDKLYYLAESATTIVDGIRRSPLMQSTSDKAAMRRYLGEALALKALGYFELIRYWGDVPYKEHASESGLGNVYIGKVDRDIVYNYIIEDLKEAIEYLPWMGEESYTVERMNKGFAKGLLAKVALFAGGWSVRDGNQFPDYFLRTFCHVLALFYSSSDPYFFNSHFSYILRRFWERLIILMSLIPVMRIFGLLSIIWNTTSIMKTCLKSLLVKDRMEMWLPRWDTS